MRQIIATGNIFSQAMHEAYSKSNCRNTFTNSQTLACFEKFSERQNFFLSHSILVNGMPLNFLNAFDGVIEYER